MSYRESPESLAEPYLDLPAHTAPITQPPALAHRPLEEFTSRIGGSTFGGNARLFNASEPSNVTGFRSTERTEVFLERGPLDLTSRDGITCPSHQNGA